MAQAYELLIVIEDGIRIAQGCFSVDRLVVRIDGNPRRTAGKAGVPARIPLHRRACIVASDCVEASEHCLGRDLLLLVDVLVPGVDFLEVPAVGERVEGRVRHAELFALVDVGRALLHVQASREHLGGEHAPLGAVVAEHRNAARLVVIVEVERVPGLALKLQLPLVEDGADIRHLRFARRPLVDDAALAVFRADVLKLEDHAEFLAVAAGVLLGLVDRDARCLADGQQVVMREHAIVHFLQVLVDARPVADVRREVAVAVCLEGAVWEGLVFGDHRDDIHAEAVDALLAPPGHHVEDGIAHLRVLPVEVRLLLGEAVQVVLVRRCIVLPGRAAEVRLPVVRLFSASAVLPDVEVAVGIRAGLAALDEPGVLVGRVVDDKVHDELDARFMCRLQQGVKVCHRAEVLHDGAVVGDVVAVVVVGRLVDRGEPDDIDAELLEIRDAARDARQVADAVAVRILETARINLIDDGLFPPGLLFFCHM